MSRKAWISLAALCVFFILYLCLLARQDPTHMAAPQIARTGQGKAKFLTANRKLLMTKHTGPKKSHPVRSEQKSSNPSEIRQVVFAKVHKAASSTVQNIMLRFAIARGLDVLLPSKAMGTGLSERTSVIKPKKIVGFPKGRHFDILCSHVIYNESEIAKYFPAKAVRVAIIREPMKQALSALTYYTNRFPTGSLIAGFKKHPDDPINGFLQYPHHFFPKRLGPAASHISNRMSVDLGFDLKNFEASKKNRTKIQAFLKQVEKQFDVVLVSDYFDESMVLLRRLLRWSMKDIIYLKVNVAKKKKNAAWSHKPRLNATVRQSFREWDEIDYELYEHFLPIFRHKVKRQRAFQAEVTAFRTIQKQVSEFCVNGTVREMKVAKSSWTDAFTVSKAECQLMTASERRLTNIARNRQIQRYKKNETDS